ncbi:galactitol-1-phosphate 5-dehydrogenase [Pantoea sp.]|uniref:galactitol-1-phosphate 5-dehydrogenase n=1 Tax=Pantoea sp. TaxID=69393 RepID=UPI002896DCFE|nr:galactitol-1-phosphate 5-dehydrogenase [Pantoea sp.]
MKALNLYEKQDVRYEDVVMPEIALADDVIIKVVTAGICGSDISRFGKIGSYNPGLTWGHEFSGIVTECGAAVSAVKRGDRVVACPCFPCHECEFCRKGSLSKCANLEVLGGHKKGAFAEYIKVPAENVVKLPDDMDFDLASFVEPSCVVVHGFNQITIKPGFGVAIVGCGTIGLLALQWAKAYGASKVYAFDTDRRKLAMAKQTGADLVFDVTEENYFQDYMAATDHGGAEVVVESSGNAAGIASSLSLAMKGGTVLLLGIPYGDVALPRTHFEKIIRNELIVRGSWNSISAPFPGSEWTTSVSGISSGKINVQPLISHKIRLSEAPALFPRLCSREEYFIKVLIGIADA